jgi:hypothetical protein
VSANGATEETLAGSLSRPGLEEHDAFDRKMADRKIRNGQIDVVLDYFPVLNLPVCVFECLKVDTQLVI